MIEVEINGLALRLETSQKLFSPKYLDYGTKAMLSCVRFTENDKVLDLGCGYGVVGIYAAKLIGGANVTMLDNKKAAVQMAEENARLNGVPDVQVVLSDGFRSLNDAGYTLILSNPPYHADFSVAKHFIEKGFNRLKIGGTMYMVTKRRPWYKNKFISVFGGVAINEIDGYFVFAAEKRSASYASC